jgi:TM2 domain-containing membrane protein YozV|nr:TM2 domain-containing protein [uncultured Faecalimonas sp.]
MRNSQDKKSTERVDFAKMALLEDELHAVEEQYGKEEKLKLWQRLGDRYFYWRENRELHKVKRKVYVLLTVFLGWAGIHRFYEKRWILGLFYLALSWTGFPIALAMVDFMIALPMKEDENGYIMI